MVTVTREFAERIASMAELLLADEFYASGDVGYPLNRNIATDACRPVS
jgi:hypothetical protein